MYTGTNVLQCDDSVDAALIVPCSLFNADSAQVACARLGRDLTSPVFARLFSHLPPRYVSSRDQIKNGRDRFCTMRRKSCLLQTLAGNSSSSSSAWKMYGDRAVINQSINRSINHEFILSTNSHKIPILRMSVEVPVWSVHKIYLRKTPQSRN